MLCNRAVGQLSRRLAQRATLALAQPLLAAFAPEAFRLRSLHVFARTATYEGEFSKVVVGDGADMDDLKKALIALFKLGAAPDRVRLLREVEGGGVPVPLDSRRALAEQGVLEGSSVLVKLPALPYVLVRLRGSQSPTKVAFAPGADADDLAKAVIAELKLDTAPDRVRLLREVEGGGVPAPLDSRRALAEQGVLDGSSVFVELPALPYVLVRLRGSLSPTKVAFAPGADADDLAKAVIAELKLDAAPDRMRLLREVEGGGVPVPLDSRMALVEQGVREGTSLTIEVMPMASA